MHMVDLMSSIICEGDTVSQELLDTVLVNLVPAHKVRLNSGLFFFFLVTVIYCVYIFTCLDFIERLVIANVFLLLGFF